MTLREKVVLRIVAVAQLYQLLFACFLLACLLFPSASQEQSSTQAQSPQGAPTYQITPVMSTITFNVKASVPIQGTFEKWDASLAFTSTNASTGSLEIKIQTDSVNTGSKSKDNRLKGAHCFDVKDYPYATFRSTQITQTGPHAFDVPGTFTLRGISKDEVLNFVADREGEGTGEIKGTLWFDRRDFGLDGGVPLVKIADRVEVTIDFKATRIGGPPLLFKQ